MLPALEAVIENHLETATPLVLEGDFIHPTRPWETLFDRVLEAVR